MYAKIFIAHNTTCWIKIKGDGHCGFRSLSYIITGNQDQHGRIRRLIQAQILEDDEMQEFHEKAWIKYFTNPKEKISEDGWMEGVDLAAASKSFMFNIYSITKDGWELFNEDVCCNKGNDGQHVFEYSTLFLETFDPEDHFDVILKDPNFSTWQNALFSEQDSSNIIFDTLFIVTLVSFMFTL